MFDTFEELCVCASSGFTCLIHEYFFGGFAPKRFVNRSKKLRCAGLVFVSHGQGILFYSNGIDILRRKKFARACKTFRKDKYFILFTLFRTFHIFLLLMVPDIVLQYYLVE